jgi:ESS family glutamate:Na+ symporter
MGKVFEGLGFSNGTTFGLAIAAVGFIVACLCGVIYLNYLKSKGKLDKQLARIASNDEMNKSIYDKDEAPLNESVDKLTMQLGLIFVVYIITYGVIALLSYLSITYLGNFGKNTVSPLLWGFNFLFGSIFAFVVKKFLEVSKKYGLFKHQHTNNFLMNRLSGLFFDVMIVAGIAAIDWQNLEGIMIPLLLVCVFGTIGTFFFVKFVCKRIFKGYEHEAFFSIFGMLTGTASTGMILLREIDPNFETPAADNLVLQQVPAIAFGAPILLLIPFAGESFENALIVFGIVIALFVLYGIILLRKYIFRKNKHRC